MSWVTYGISILVIFGVSLSGCTSLNHCVMDKPEEQSINHLLGYFQHLKNISNEELHREFATTRLAYLENNNEINALKFSFLLIYSDFTNQNEYQPIDILRGVTQRTNNNTLKDLSSLLQHILLDNEKKETLYKLTSEQLNDAIEEKKEKEVEQETIEEKLNRILDENKKQELRYRRTLKKLIEQEQMVEKLQKKIEELKEIERSINERKDAKDPTT